MPRHILLRLIPNIFNVFGILGLTAMFFPVTFGRENLNFTLMGALGMFLYGMNLMSSGLQKAAGDKLRGLLSSMTSNPFKGVMTGLGVTSVIQSSSATTVMVVSFVNAGLLTLTQAIGVIMGANIGTTVTAWMVSWLGFKADISLLAVPLMLLGFLFSNSKKNQRQNVGACNI